MRKITIKELMEKLNKLPLSTKIEVLTECKACFKFTEETMVRFYRVDLEKRRKTLRNGYKCDKCGYLNEERQG